MIYVAETAVVVGDVALDRDVSLWHHAVLRGDLESIAVGASTNLQDGAVVHTDVGQPARLGRRVTVGHGAIVHACTVGDDVIVGMGAVLSSGAVVGPNTIVASGAVVPEGREVGSGVLVGGVPARTLRALEDADRVRIEGSWRVYVELAKHSLAPREDRGPTPGARASIGFLEDAES